MVSALGKLRNFKLDPKVPLLFVLAYFLVQFSLVVFFEPIRSADSWTYARLGQKLIDNGFNIIPVLNAGRDEQQLGFRIAYIYFVGILRFFFAEKWETILCVVSLAVLCVPMVKYLQSLQQRNASLVGQVFAMCLIALSWDLLSWPHYSLSDTLYAGLIWLAFLQALEISSKKGCRPIFPSLVLIFFTRPTGVVFIGGLIVAGLFLRETNRRSSGSPSVSLLNHPREALLIMIFGGGITFSILVNYLIKRPVTNQGVSTLLGQISQGVVVHDRPETWLGPTFGLLAYFKLYCYKFAFFFTPGLKAFSRGHNIYNLVFFSFLYTGAVIAWKELPLLAKQLRKTVLFAATLIVITAIYHAATLIDFDWRYRFPIIPLLIMTSVEGVEWLVNGRHLTEKQIR